MMSPRTTSTLIHYLLVFFVLTLGHFPNTATGSPIAVRPFTAHFFYEKFAAEMSGKEKRRYASIFTNPNVSKAQAENKLDAISRAKSGDFWTQYVEWKTQQDKHNIEWWQVNDVRMAKTSANAQQLYESIKDVTFNRTISFVEDCVAYNRLLERASKKVRGELTWGPLNCSDSRPPLNPHGHLSFKLIL